jgi:hypothetical protein
MTSWCEDMGLAPEDEYIDIADKYGCRYVRCYRKGWGWWGKDIEEYESVSEPIRNPTHWMKVEMPK